MRETSRRERGRTGRRRDGESQRSIERRTKFLTRCFDQSVGFFGLTGDMRDGGAEDVSQALYRPFGAGIGNQLP